MKRWHLAVCLSAACFGGTVSAVAQTQYTNDGAMAGIEEEVRWYVNRARYDPVKEKARLGLGSSVPSGPIAPLAPNAKLITAAQRHSEDMARLDVFGHNSPTGSFYYPAGYTCFQRINYEGYSYSWAGENIAVGYASGREAHEGWFLSESGHRDNLLNENFREVGIGYYYDGPSTFGRHYTEDLAAPSASTEHWFTGTIFLDQGNGAYDSGEGVGGIDVYLRTSAGLHSWYDWSSASGSFAIPITSIPDATDVEVVLVNNSGSATDVSIPLNYDTLLRVTLTNGQSYVYGAFAQPTSVQNVGFRDVVPSRNRIVATLSAADGVGVTAETLPGGRYALDWRQSLASRSWAGAATSTAAAVTTTFFDAGGPDRPAPGLSTSRFYRVVLLRGL